MITSRGFLNVSTSYIFQTFFLTKSQLNNSDERTEVNRQSRRETKIIGSKIFLQDRPRTIGHYRIFPANQYSFGLPNVVSHKPNFLGALHLFPSGQACFTVSSPVLKEGRRWFASQCSLGRFLSRLLASRLRSLTISLINSSITISFLSPPLILATSSGPP
jgi:hypothetical protein